jgi:starch synthase
MTGLIPAYIKTAYKREAVFGNSKVIFTIGENTFEDKLGADFIKKAIINANIKEKDLEVFKDNNNTALFKGGATYADAITFGAENIDKKLSDEFAKVKGKKVVPFKGWDTDLTEYIDLYNELASK